MHAEASRELPQFSQRNDPLLSPDLPPAGSTARTSYGKLLEDQGKIDEALATYDVILSKRPNIAGIHKNLGMIYTQYKHDAAKARRHFQESLRLAPNQPQAAIIRGILAQLSAAK